RRVAPSSEGPVARRCSAASQPGGAVRSPTRSVSLGTSWRLAGPARAPHPQRLHVLGAKQPIAADSDAEPAAKRHLAKAVRHDAELRRDLLDGGELRQAFAASERVGIP